MRKIKKRRGNKFFKVTKKVDYKKEKKKAKKQKEEKDKLAGGDMTQQQIGNDLSQEVP